MSDVYSVLLKRGDELLRLQMCKKRVTFSACIRSQRNVTYIDHVYI